MDRRKTIVIVKDLGKPRVRRRRLGIKPRRKRSLGDPFPALRGTRWTGPLGRREAHRRRNVGSVATEESAIRARSAVQSRRGRGFEDRLGGFHRVSEHLVGSGVAEFSAGVGGDVFVVADEFGLVEVDPAEDERGAEEEDEGPEADEREEDEDCEEGRCVGPNAVCELATALSVSLCQGQTGDPGLCLGHCFGGWFDGVIEVDENDGEEDHVADDDDDEGDAAPL